MADFETDPDAMDAVGQSISALADSGPGGSQPPADECGSGVVAHALGEDGGSFGRAWAEAEKGAHQAAAGVAAAATAYRESDEAVAADAADSRASGVKR